MGASILNFDQRDIVKTRQNCFFPYISFTSMWQLQHTYLRSTLASSALRPPPVSLTHDMLVHKGMTAAPLDWIVLTWNGRHDLSTKLFPLSLVVLLYPFLADQYIILSLNIRIFQTHFLYFIWLFSLNGFYVMS